MRASIYVCIHAGDAGRQVEIVEYLLQNKADATIVTQDKWVYVFPVFFHVSFSLFFRTKEYIHKADASLYQRQIGPC